MNAVSHRLQALARGVLSASVVLVACMALAGCGSRGVTLADVAADPSIVTGSVAAGPRPTTNPTELSDAATIRNVISALDLDAGPPSELAWANVETGSRGALRGVSEHSERGTLCRRFEATRESFDGIALYTGESCMAPGGIWAMTAFDRL